MLHPCDRSHRAGFTGKVDEVPADTSTPITRMAKEASEQPKQNPHGPTVSVEIGQAEGAAVESA